MRVLCVYLRNYSFCERDGMYESTRRNYIYLACGGAAVQRLYLLSLNINSSLTLGPLVLFKL